MKLEKLSRLFTAQDIPAQNSATQVQNQTESSAAGAADPAISGEAVKVSNGFSGITSAGIDTDRSARVVELKKAVADGTYKPDSREVAKAVITDLLA